MSVNSTKNITTSYPKIIAKIINDTDWSQYGYKTKTDFICDIIKRALKELGLFPLAKVI